MLSNQILHNQKTICTTRKSKFLLLPIDDGIAQMGSGNRNGSQSKRQSSIYHEQYTNFDCEENLANVERSSASIRASILVECFSECFGQKESNRKRNLDNIEFMSAYYLSGAKTIFSHQCMHIRSFGRFIGNILSQQLNTRIENLATN